MDSLIGVSPVRGKQRRLRSPCAARRDGMSPRGRCLEAVPRPWRAQRPGLRPNRRTPATAGAPADPPGWPRRLLLGLHGFQSFVAARFRAGPVPVLREPALGQAGVALERDQRVRAMLLPQCLDRLATRVACVQRHRDPLQVHFLEQPRIAAGSPPFS